MRIGPAANADDEPTEIGAGEPVEEVLPDQVSRPYAPRTLRDLSTAELFKWMSRGRRIGEVPPKPGKREIDVWEGPVAGVVHALWNARRPDSADERAAITLDPAPPPPEAGFAHFRLRTSSGRKTTTSRWHLSWSRGGARLIEGSILELDEEPAWFEKPDRQLSPPVIREFTAAQGRRLAEILLALAHCRRAEDCRADEVGQVIVSFAASEELIIQGDGEAAPLFERRADVTDLVLSATCWKGAWRGEMALSLASNALNAALGLPPLRRDREGRAEAASRGAVARVLELERATPGTIHGTHLTSVAEQVGEAGWREFGEALAAIAARLPEPTAWEQTLAARAKEIERRVTALLARENARLLEEVIDLPSGVRSLGEDGTSDSPEERLDAEVRAELEAIRELRRVQNDSALSPSLSDPEESLRDLARLRKALAVALRQLSARDDRTALCAWALEDAPGAGWAYWRLRALDPTASEAVFEGRLRDQPRQDFRLRLTLAEFEKVVPARAAAALAKLPASRRAFLASGENPEDETTKNASEAELLSFVRNRGGKAAMRTAAVRRLVPQENPRLRASEEVDRILTETLRGEEKCEGFAGDNVIRELALALARRDAARHWDVIEASLSKLDAERDDGAWVIREMLPAVLADPVRFRPRMAELLRPRLELTSGSREEFLWIAWLADARELRALIASMATSSPSDQGAEEGGGGPGRWPVKHRIHLARQIASIWDESDPAARLRLKVAIAFRSARNFTGRFPVAPELLGRELRRDAALLDTGARASVRDAVKALDQEELESGENDDDAIDAVAKIVREALGGN